MSLANHNAMNSVNARMAMTKAFLALSPILLIRGVINAASSGMAMMRAGEFSSIKSIFIP